MKTVLMMAGGTGGHVFPALEVAQALKEQGYLVHWLGTKAGIEARLVEAAGFRLHTIKVQGLRGKGLRKLIAMPWVLVRAIWQARRVIRSLSPDVVIGMGGFASGPGGVVAWCLHIPLLIHEQNAVAGYTNRILAFFAKRVLSAFPDVLTTHQARCVGNPVRKQFFELPSPEARFSEHTGAVRILVLGGSLGASILNEVVPKAVARLSSIVAIRHQCGQRDYEKTLEQYALMKEQVEVMPFIDDMASAYAWADVVVCRSGALTVSELAAVGLPSILIPYPHAVDDHQRLNAAFLVNCGAAKMMIQKDLTVGHLCAELDALCTDAKRRLHMAEQALTVRTPHATAAVVEQAVKLLNKEENA